MRVLITGASRGIGRYIALRLARSGSSLFLSGSTDSDSLRAVAQQARGQGAEVETMAGDLADPCVPAELMSRATTVFGGLDGLVSNAGITRPATMEKLEVDDWDHLFAINVRATWLLAKAAAQTLEDSEGSFVSITSMSGQQPYPGMGAYSPSKAAVEMLVRTLAQEWGSRGVRANAVAPGLFRTPLTEAVYAHEDTLRRREAMVPLGYIGNPESDIAGVVEFLLSDAARYMTGQVLVVDGGLLESIQSRLPGRPASNTTQS